MKRKNYLINLLLVLIPLISCTPGYNKPIQWAEIKSQVYSPYIWEQLFLVGNIPEVSITGMEISGQ